MSTLKKQFSSKLFIALFVSVLVLAPNTSFAATQYKPQTNEEIVAYLYGRISQLLEIQAMLQNGGSISTIQPTASQNTFSPDYVTVSTHKASDVKSTTAILRGEVILFGKATASVWFEYGRDENFLDQRTSKKSVRSAYDRAVRVSVSKLEDDKRYYYRLVSENKDKSVTYGKIFEFRTDELD